MSHKSALLMDIKNKIVHLRLQLHHKSEGQVPTFMEVDRMKMEGISWLK